MDQKSNVIHPSSRDLSFLYGVIFMGKALDCINHSRNVCVFADGEVDRSPTGSGVSGRMAIHALRGELKEESFVSIESIIGSTFQCSYVQSENLGPYKAVIPEVHGTSYYTAENHFVIEDDDPFQEGFLLK